MHDNPCIFLWHVLIFQVREACKNTCTCVIKCKTFKFSNTQKIKYKKIQKTKKHQKGLKVKCVICVNGDRTLPLLPLVSKIASSAPNPHHSLSQCCYARLLKPTEQCCDSAIKPECLHFQGDSTSEQFTSNCLCILNWEYS